MSLALPHNYRGLAALTVLTNLQDLKFFYYGNSDAQLEDAQILMDSMTQLKKLNAVVREVSDMFNIKKITGLKELSVELGKWPKTLAIISKLGSFK